jgi:hypothetical protein
MRKQYLPALLLLITNPAFAQSSNSGEPGTPGYQRGEIQSGVAPGSTAPATAVRPGVAPPAAVAPGGAASSGEPGTAGYARGEARSGINPSSPPGGAGDAGAPPRR